MRYLLYLLFAVCLPFASFAEDNLSKAPDVSNLEELTVENLERAAALWQVEDVEKLQQKGFDFNQKDGAGNTLLYDVLSQNQNDGVAEKLIEYGADVNTPSASGMLPINVTTSKANELQLQIMMMETMGLDTDDPKVKTELEKNVFYEMERMLKSAELLIKSGADINKESALGTPLMNAVTNLWNVDIVDLLLKAGADVNKQDKDGRTALFYAYASGNDDFVTILIKAGANVEIKDKDGLTYLEVEKLVVE